MADRELQARRRCHGGRAGQRLLVAPVVGEGHPHPDGLAQVFGSEGVGGPGGAGDIRVTGQPPVLEDNVVQAVDVHNARGVGRQRLAHLRDSIDARPRLRPGSSRGTAGRWQASYR